MSLADSQVHALVAQCGATRKRPSVKDKLLQYQLGATVVLPHRPGRCNGADARDLKIT